MEYVMLKDVCTINMGQSPDSDSYNDNGEGVPFFQGNADFGERYPVTRKWCSAPTKIAVPEDILISVRAPIGAMNYAREKCCIGRGLAALTPDKTKVSPEFVFWLLKCKNAELNSKGTGSTFKAIGRKVLEETKVPDIPLEKQLEYSETLEKVYAVIQHRKSELQMLDELIKARFVEMFGLPVSNTKGWQTELMEDVAPIVNYKGKFDEEIWLLNLDMVEAQTGRILDYLIVNEDEVGNSTCTFDASNVLYSKLRPYLNKVVMPDRCGYATSELIPLQPVNTKINREYLAFMLRSDEFVNMINEKVAGAKMPRVSMGDFRKFSVPVPPIELQNQFADFVDQVDKSEVAVQKALDETQLLFDSLMQQYFG